MSQILNPSNGGAGGGITIIGNVGSASGSTIGLVTKRSTVVFEGLGSFLQLDFGISNLILGTDPLDLTSGLLNVGLGFSVLSDITSGSSNICIGAQSGDSITAGDANILIGSLSGNNLTASNNTAVGSQTLQNAGLAAFNLILGFQAGTAYTTTESSNILLSSSGLVGESNTTRIGSQGSGNRQQNRCFIAGIIGTTITSPQSVTIDPSSGQLGVQALNGGIITVTGQLISSQIKALHATPIEAIGAPGGGKIINLISASFSYIYGGSNPFTGLVSTIAAYYGTTTAIATIFSNSNITGTANLVSTIGGPSLSGIATASIENLPLNLYNPNVTELAGNAANDNVINYQITYVISNA